MEFQRDDPNLPPWDPKAPKFDCIMKSDEDAKENNKNKFLVKKLLPKKRSYALMGRVLKWIEFIREKSRVCLEGVLIGNGAEKVAKVVAVVTY